MTAFQQYIAYHIVIALPNIATTIPIALVGRVITTEVAIKERSKGNEIKSRNYIAVLGEKKFIAP